MNYYDEIKNKLVENEIYSKVKDYSKEKYRINTYFEIGKLLSEAGKIYGKDIIGQYSKKLQLEVGKKYNRRYLFRMKQFYNIFRDEKVSLLATHLSWSHYIELLSIKDKGKLLYYLNTAINNNLTRNELREKIKNKEYERLPNSTKNKLIVNEEKNLEDFIKNSIVIKNNYNYEKISEKVLTIYVIYDIFYID